MKESEKIRQACKEAGLRPAEVLRKANAAHDTLVRWDKKDPTTLVTRANIYNAIKLLSDERNKV